MSIRSVETIAIAEDLFRGSENNAELIGSRCLGCNTVYFPKRLGCSNPKCTQKSVIDTALSRHGVLYSYTIQAYRPPPLFRMEPWSPYAIGLVELPEGLRVMGLLSGLAPDAIRIGLPVEVTVVQLCTDDGGRKVLTYAFRPTTTGVTSP